MPRSSLREHIVCACVSFFSASIPEIALDRRKRPTYGVRRGASTGPNPGRAGALPVVLVLLGAFLLVLRS